MATSQVAVNRIFNARDEGRPIPLGWGVDERGEPTTDAAAVRSAVPLGGYKGYALAVMVEILCGVLAGAGVRDGVGALYGEAAASARTPATSTSRSTRSARSGATGSRRCSAGCSDELRASPVAPGFDEVLAPGDPEARARAERERSGVPIEPALWARLGELSAELGVVVPG